jgi:hypothetical protein
VECIRLSQECPEEESREHSSRNGKGIRGGVIGCFSSTAVRCTLVVFVRIKQSDFVKRAMNFQAVQGQGVSWPPKQL